MQFNSVFSFVECMFFGVAWVMLNFPLRFFVLGNFN